MRYPTIRQLQYFTALAEHVHFGRAAEASFVSQSAFSTAIADLEATLETQLVDRTNKQVTITATGQDVANIDRQHSDAAAPPDADPSPPEPEPRDPASTDEPTDSHRSGSKGSEP